MKRSHKVIILSASVVGVLAIGCKIVLGPLIGHYTDPYHKKVIKAGFVEKQ